MGNCFCILPMTRGYSREKNPRQYWHETTHNWTPCALRIINYQDFLPLDPSLIISETSVILNISSTAFYCKNRLVLILSCVITIDPGTTVTYNKSNPKQPCKKACNLQRKPWWNSRWQTRNGCDGTLMAKKLMITIQICVTVPSLCFTRIRH